MWALACYSSFHCLFFFPLFTPPPGFSLFLFIFLPGSEAAISL